MINMAALHNPQYNFHWQKGQAQAKAVAVAWITIGSETRTGIDMVRFKVDAEISPGQFVANFE